jgi:hypothetical protein
METPEETLSRIAYGGYRCHVNTTSGGVHTLLKMTMNFHCFDMLCWNLLWCWSAHFWLFWLRCATKLLAAYSYQVAICTCVVVQLGHFGGTSGVCVSASNEILQFKSIWIDECAYSYQVAICICVVVQLGHFDGTSGVCVSASNEILQFKSIWIDEC